MRKAHCWWSAWGGGYPPPLVQPDRVEKRGNARGEERKEREWARSSEDKLPDGGLTFVLFLSARGCGRPIVGGPHGVGGTPPPLVQPDRASREERESEEMDEKRVNETDDEKQKFPKGDFCLSDVLFARGCGSGRPSDGGPHGGVGFPPPRARCGRVTIRPWKLPR